MARKEIHPEYHEITLILTDKTEIKTMSTFGEAGARIALEIDPLSHSAWQTDTGKIKITGAAAKFASKFGVMNILNTSSATKKKTDTAE